MISSLVRNFKGSAIRKMYNMTTGKDNIINLSVGEPDFITPSEAIETACSALKAGKTHYTPSKGILELRNSIVGFHAQEFSCNADEEIIITAGATEALELAIFTLVNPGDEVIIISPSWPNYFGQLQMAGAVCRSVVSKEENYFIPCIDDIKNAISAKTKLIILNSPCNPTGAIMPKPLMRQIANLLIEYDLQAITDEVYRNIIYDNNIYTSMYSFEDVQDRIVLVNSFSKMFAMTGWRIGYAIGPSKVINGMTLLHENGVSCLPEPFQLAASFAMENLKNSCASMCAEFEKRRNYSFKLLNEIPGLKCVKPNGAFYHFVNMSKTRLDSEQFCFELLKKERVVTVPGNGFGNSGEGYFRISFATSMNNLELGINRIKHFVESLN